MGDEQQDKEADPKQIQAFLQRLSRDKHAFGAHLGMRVERDYTALEKHEREQEAERTRRGRKPL